MNTPDLITDMDRLWREAPVAQRRTWRNGDGKMQQSASQLIAIFDPATDQWLREQREALPLAPRSTVKAPEGSAAPWLQAERVVYETSRRRIRALLREGSALPTPGREVSTASLPANHGTTSSSTARTIAACAGAFVCRFWLEVCEGRELDAPSRQLAAERLLENYDEILAVLRAALPRTTNQMDEGLLAWLEAKRADIRRRMAWVRLPMPSAAFHVTRMAA